MSSTAELLPGHPVARALTGIDEVLAGAVGAPLWSLSAGELERLVLASYATSARLAGLLTRLVGEADARAVADGVGATSTTAWLVGAGRVGPSAASAAVHTARAVRRELTATGSALDAGIISAEHAAVIARAVTELPSDLLAEARREAERVLLEAAADLDPRAVARFGRRVVETVDPDGAEERLGRELERAEARAARDQYLRVTPDGIGGCWLRGRLGVPDAAALRAVLDPLAAPRPAGHDGPDPRRHDQRMADALGEACRLLLGTDDLPTAGGQPTQVVVTVTWEVLRTGLGSASVGPDGDPVSPGLARRLACDATILPAVLGEASEPLDVGRRVRLFTGGLRRALDLRDGGCAFPGCDRPPRWCEGHHIVSWWAGGVTSLGNGVLLCGHHHSLVHEGDWTVRMSEDARPEFTPPAWIDPERRPRRNTRLRR